MPARYGLVLEAMDAGRRLVFRASPDPDGVHQGRVSIALADLGVGPAIHEFIQTDTGTWTVADRIMPGTPLGRLTATDSELDAICDVLRPLIGQPAPAADMPSQAARLRDRLADDRLADLPIGREVAPLPERLRALATLDDLVNSGAEGLCHGDTSSRNFLVSRDNRLLLIDPRGVTGDVAYDLAVVSLKVTRNMPPMEIMWHFIAKMTIDPERIIAWRLAVPRGVVGFEG